MNWKGELMDERCRICSRRYRVDSPGDKRAEYTLVFNGVCEPCGMTLILAFGGCVDMLREAHGENRERMLARIMDRLERRDWRRSA
jgi:hypothetical protein